MSDVRIPLPDDNRLNGLKSHLMSFMIGFCGGAFVSVMIVLATAIAYKSGI